MRDDQIKELISAYLDDELSVEERALVERHLADSVECQQFLDRIRQQRTALQSLPRRKLKGDFSQRVLQAIEQARPEQARPTVSTEPVVAAPSQPARWKSWQRSLITIGTVAALAMIALYVTNGRTNPGPKPGEVTGDDKKPPVKLPDEVKTPEESVLPKLEPLSQDTLLAVGEFQRLVQYVTVFDVTLTPRAQKNRTFEAWLEKAGIPKSKGIVLDQKLEQEILSARFVQDKVAPAKGKEAANKEGDDVEMLFVRGTIRAIEAVGKPFFLDGEREKKNPEIIMQLELVFAPRDLYIFLELNKASGLDVATIKAQPSVLKKAEAFPLQFGTPIRSVGLARFESDVQLAAAADVGSPFRLVGYTPDNRRSARSNEVLIAQAANSAQDNNAPENNAPGAAKPDAASAAQVNPAEPNANTANSLDEPSQAIFIIRRLKEEPKPAAN